MGNCKPFITKIMITLLSVHPKGNENLKAITKVVGSLQNNRRFILTSNWDENYGVFPNLEKRIYKDFLKSKVLTISNPYQSSVSPENNEDYFIGDGSDMSIFIVQKGFRHNGSFNEYPAVSIESLLNCISNAGMNIPAGMHKFLSKTNIERSDFNLVVRASNTNEVFVLNVNHPEKIAKLPIYLTLSSSSSMLMTTNYNYADHFRKVTNEKISMVTPNIVYGLEVTGNDIKIRD
jgi:hypothetical protein